MSKQCAASKHPLAITRSCCFSFQRFALVTFSDSQPLPMSSIRNLFIASAVPVTCFACLLTLLKSVLYTGCSGSGDSTIRPLTIACLAAAAMSVVAGAAQLFKSRAWSLTLAAAICSTWQPLYFVFLTLQMLTLKSIVTHAVIQDTRGALGACSENDIAVHAISWTWFCTVTIASLAAILCDMDSALSPALRRCTYGFLTLILLLDGIGSVVWGNPLASDVTISYANINFNLSSQITSCIMSQLLVSAHFLYVSFRSRHGRGWAYASLRFGLDERGRSFSMPTLQPMTDRRSSSAGVPMLAMGASGPSELRVAGSSTWSRLRLRILQFQQRHVSRCRVFVIPCVVIRDAGGVGVDGFAVARPMFRLRWLAPLQRLADSHPRLFMVSGFLFLGVPCLACYIFLNEGISTLVLNSAMCIMMFGFLSSRRYGLDRVAAKHVMMSFRFGIFVLLSAGQVALSVRRVYTLNRHITFVVANTLVNILYCLCILLDCSPHLPQSVQIFLSVDPRA